MITYRFFNEMVLEAETEDEARQIFLDNQQAFIEGVEVEVIPEEGITHEELPEEGGQ